MKKFFIFAISICQVLVNAQEKVIDIPWMENDSTLYFNQASYNDETGQIPIYTKIVPWTSEGMAPLISVDIINSSPINNKFCHQVTEADLTESPVLNYSIVFEKKKAMLQISLLPFFKNSETGETEQINSFILNISEQAQMASLKSLRKGSFGTSSVLATNDWYKVAIDKSGIYKLSYEELKKLGIDNPARVKIFGAGAILLPEDFSMGSYDDLTELPIYMNKGTDQLFGPGDYILFYALGPVDWHYDIDDDFYSQQLHNYSERGYYFIREGIGTATFPENIELSNGPADNIVTAYDILTFQEDEKYNLLKSGREWYGDEFKIALNYTYAFSLKDLLLNEAIKIRLTAAGRSNEISSMKISANNSNLGTLSFATVNLSSYTATYAVENAKIFEYTPSNEIINVKVEYVQPNSNSAAWLNHITLNGRSDLKLSADELIFRDSRSVVFGTTSEFRLKNATSNTVIWDISTPTLPANVPYNLSGSIATFKVNTDNLREFIAFNPEGNFPVPIYEGEGLGKIANQNLHGTSVPDMIIIYAKKFEEQVQRLAEHRRSYDNFDVLTITQEEIFNEFSSGTPNISAIRNYLKMYYDNSTPESMVRYLLLFGDGSYDNRDTADTNPNLIMTYQSSNSLAPTSSYVSDDFFGLLDTGEKLYNGLLDIGIGRLPVSTVEEAELLVDKIIEYDQVQTIGEWRNYICMIGDDEDGNIHMKQANSLANYIEDNYPDYNINKIFLDAYTQETTPTGDLYPDVTRAINDQMNRGALIINYTGHGSVNGLAHEKILDLTNIKGWHNTGKYPLFMTATCEFSRYDEYYVSQSGNNSEVTSAGEEVLLNPVGGSIALFTTTRLVYSGPNHVLNEKFYEIVFKKKENGESYRLGDIIVYSKNNAGAGINKRNFTLLGDPATSLSYPKNVVITDSINHKSINGSTDTLSALNFVTISGHMEDQNGSVLSNFNGTVIPIVFDKKSKQKTLANDGGSPMDFSTRNNILYKGNTSVTKGKFSFSFYVPKDIAYNIGSGKISYYGYTDQIDAHGSTNSITIGGLGDFSELDTVGPSISLYMNDSLFKNGGIVTSSPELLIYVNDPYGINTTGNGIGHDITATLNDDRINAIILNEYYVANTNSYSSGSVRYPYSKLPDGKQTIHVKVWDIFNNSSSKSIDFIVVESKEMLLNNIFNFPNPFYDITFFNIEHNRPEQELELKINIYDLKGNLVSILKNNVYAGGYRIDPPSWQGTGMGGNKLGSGLYIYRILVKTENGEEAAGSGRLIIKR